MRIVDGKTYIVGNPWKNWVFVRLETDEGIYGIGEGTLNGFAKTTEACISELSPFYIGMDPFQIGIGAAVFTVVSYGVKSTQRPLLPPAAPVDGRPDSTISGTGR
jgi:L-alanine-DL-glutamate epimerase-like enolase superfamily enzyme